MTKKDEQPFPANTDKPIAVSASPQDDRLAGWSCQGSYVRISAPGKGIVSTSNGIGVFSGTSK